MSVSHGLPNWREDMNACLRDIVPVLEARNLAWMIAHGGTGGRYSCAVYPRGDDPGEMITAFGETVSAAFCEAAIEALEATNVLD